MARKTSVFGNVRTFESLLQETGSSASDLRSGSDIGAPIREASSSSSSSSSIDEIRKEDASVQPTTQPRSHLPPREVGQSRKAASPPSYVRRTRHSRRFVQPQPRRNRGKNSRFTAATPADIATPILDARARGALDWLDSTLVSSSGTGGMSTRSSRLHLPTKATRRKKSGNLGHPRSRGKAEHWYSDSDILDVIMAKAGDGGDSTACASRPHSPEPLPGEYASESALGEGAEAFEKCFFKFMRHVADFSMRAHADSDDFEMRRRIYEGARGVLLDPSNLQRMRDGIR